MTSNIDKALPHFVRTDTTIQSLLSDRVYPLKLPPGATLPAITFQEISLAGDQPHNEKLQLPRKRYQFTVYAGLIEDAVPLTIALKARLDGYRGNMGTGTYITIVDGVLLKDARMTDDPLTGLFVRQQDYLITIKE